MEILDDDSLQLVCSEMNDLALLNFVRTHKRASSLCRNELRKRIEKSTDATFLIALGNIFYLDRYFNLIIKELPSLWVAVNDHSGKSVYHVGGVYQFETYRKDHAKVGHFRHDLSKILMHLLSEGNFELAREYIARMQKENLPNLDAEIFIDFLKWTKHPTLQLFRLFKFNMPSKEYGQFIFSAQNNILHRDDPVEELVYYGAIFYTLREYIEGKLSGDDTPELNRLFSFLNDYARSYIKRNYPQFYRTNAEHIGEEEYAKYLSMQFYGYY